MALVPPTFAPEVINESTQVQLEAFLDEHRVALRSCLDGLTEEQARRSLVASRTTLLGLVKHATFVEKVWFEQAITGRSRAEIGIPESSEESFVLDDDDTIFTVQQAHGEACESSRRATESIQLDDIVRGTRWGPLPMRWVYFHVLRELAQHCGHADILREQVTMNQPTLLLTVGLPCTGKTTAARRFEVEHKALRLTKDEWVKALYGPDNPPAAQDVIEGRLIRIGLRALELGNNVVIDYGLWSRDERSALRHAAAALGARVELRYFELTPAEQRTRLDERQAEAPHTTWPMSDAELAQWAASIDVPTPGELDGSEPIDDPPAGFASWDEWRERRWPPSVF